MLFAVSLAACSGATSPDLELTAARLRWQQRQPASYDITVSRSCECTPASIGPVVVAVRDGVVVSRTYVATGAPVAPTLADVFPAVEGLFAIITDAQRRHAASVVVHYDGELGFPSVISIDYNRQAVDDEFSISANNFVAR